MNGNECQETPYQIERIDEGRYEVVCGDAEAIGEVIGLAGHWRAKSTLTTIRSPFRTRADAALCLYLDVLLSRPMAA